MPFDYEKYGFTENDLYGQALKLAVIVYNSQMDFQLLSVDDHRDYYDTYVSIYKQCLEQHDLLDERRDVIDYGACVPLEQYCSSDKTTDIANFYAEYISTDFDLVLTVEEEDSFMMDEEFSIDSLAATSLASDDGFDVMASFTPVGCLRSIYNGFFASRRVVPLHEEGNQMRMDL